MARPAGRTKSSPVCIQACRTESRDKLLTDACDTLLAFNGSAIFFIRKTLCDWLCGDDAVFVKLLWPLVRLLVPYVWLRRRLTGRAWRNRNFLSPEFGTKFHRKVPGITKIFLQHSVLCMICRSKEASMPKIRSTRSAVSAQYTGVWQMCTDTRRQLIRR